MIEEILLSLVQGIWTLTVCVALCFWIQKKSDREIGVTTPEESKECREKMKKIEEWLKSH